MPQRQTTTREQGTNPRSVASSAPPPDFLSAEAQHPTSLEGLNALLLAAEPRTPGATQAVPGEGPADAPIIFVGEQPGDQEDRQGRPFVGPAGQFFTRALAEVGLDRRQLYLTNAVKHFRFELRGKRRIHSKPSAADVKHDRWWLMQEAALIRPKLVVALGATAVLALTGRAIPITRARGPARFGEQEGYITVHPSYLLRLPDAETKRRAYEEFLTDLERIRDLAHVAAPATSGEELPRQSRLKA